VKVLNKKLLIGTKNYKIIYYKEGTDANALFEVD